ncbi:3'-5' exonuclease DinG [Paraburkholderia graminis C4D1M]|uniref:DEAD_2 domain protein n=1 Tax=Paraburkholderia graminis (strain ATCC 700544 / DSM 17151 / LMG 18924 / NCIMB 13744 / C4D1M) TaxID=396598 RepID=B1FTN0_PARG4|nr:ATP-dependent DNA helicase [Paraburkholderia graminis]EDT13038.1 DEAD_2 domain protein [Paraburkholderia graminis C4D1M]CAB3717963.1 3'-5' exonuclease DinG [Paraburkholderia graminis C4D1M]
MSYIVAVRAMCEFTARRGDLDLRFTPAPTSLEGMAGHVTVAGRRASGYESEMTLTATHRNLTVRGRADGYDPAANRLEEIKTHRGDLERMPANHRTLHWAQALVYGHMLCRARGLGQLTVALVYFDVGSQKETLLTQTHTARELEVFFVEQCERFLDWAVQEEAHRAARNAALGALQFPHAQFRSGQRELAVSVYRAARDGKPLMAQAPTGIGKTLATIFPLLKACAAEQIDRVFFLTAKTPGRALALDAIETLRRSAAPLPLRTLELVARDKACEHPDKACNGESCPLARGFYDRLDAARSAALAGPRLDRAAVRAAALAHDVCPYYLAQELARWADVVVGDYNYYYDSSAMLYALTQINQWRVGVLVDEAHNLLDRARRMYTASLDQAALRLARNTAPPTLRKPLERLQREWNALKRAQTASYEVYADVPGKLLSAAQNLIGAVTDQLAEAPLSIDQTSLRFFFDAMHFVALAEQFGEHSIFDIMLTTDRHAPRDKTSCVLCVRNVIPAPFLAPRYAAARTTVMFSGTLSPHHFYRDTLGLAEDTSWLDVEGPFRAEQLQVRVAGNVSTRWRDRDRSLEPIVELIARQYTAQPGNYLGFLSSFEYLQRVVALMRERNPDVPVWAQEPGMDEAARDAFLARFRGTDQGVGFAVLGGAFSEGVDLVGQQLIGAFIATLGLPQMNEVNEQMRRTMEARFGSGYEYMYLYPGLQKVVQAAGRVIRTEHDEGVVHLIDDRYRRPEVRRLLPRWWQVQ